MAWVARTTASSTISGRKTHAANSLRKGQRHTRSFNSELTPEKWCLEDDSVLLGWHISGAMLNFQGVDLPKNSSSQRKWRCSKICFAPLMYKTCSTSMITGGRICVCMWGILDILTSESLNFFSSTYIQTQLVCKYPSKNGVWMCFALGRQCCTSTFVMSFLINKSPHIRWSKSI